MRRFLLQHLDRVVAEGVQFSNGKCTVTGITDLSVTIYDSIACIDQNKEIIIQWVDFEIDVTITDSNGRSVVKRHPVIVSED